MKTKTRNYLLLFAGILLLSVFVTATNYIDNSKGQVSKTLTNDSGMYYNDGNSYRGVSSGTADVVVCRGLNAYDDIYKSVKWASGCDVVCKSTDTSCGNEINDSIALVSNNGGGLVYISSGVYPNSIYVNPRSNVKVIGSGSGTVLNLTGRDEYFRDFIGNLNNFELGNLKIINSYNGLSVGFDIPSAPASNIYLHDLYIQGNYHCIRINGEGGQFQTPITNVKIERITTNNCSMTFGSIRGLKLLNGYYNNSGDVNTFMDIGYNEGDNIMDDVLIQGNTYLNYKHVPCISSSGNMTNVRIIDNHFYCNETITMSTDSSVWRTDLLFSGNDFHSITGTSKGSVFISMPSRDSKSILNIVSNSFYDDDNSSYAISSKTRSNIVSNTFYGLGYIAISTYAPSHITGNLFKDNSRYAPTWRWVSFGAGSSYSSLIANHFFTSSDNANTVIQIQAVQNISIKSNTFEGMTASPYTLWDGINGIEYNTTYIDNYQYTKINQICGSTPDSPFYGNTIHNSSTSCTCTGGSWKCWGMS